MSQRWVKSNRSEKKRTKKRCATTAAAGPVDGSLDLRAGRLEQTPVLDAGRADGLAGAAVEALFHLMHEAGAGQIELPLGDRFDEGDAAAGARRLDQGLHVGRTGRQAESAAHATIVDIGWGQVGAGETLAGTWLSITNGRGIFGWRCRFLPPCPSSRVIDA